MKLKGIYPIVPTPFLSSGAVDLESIDKVTGWYCQLSESRVKPQQESTRIGQAPVATLHSLKERARSNR